LDYPVAVEHQIAGCNEFTRGQLQTAGMAWSKPIQLAQTTRRFRWKNRKNRWHVMSLIKTMPEQKTLERARRDAREGKSPSTQAGEFVREEFHHIREGKHGARSTKQAIAIGLSKARRAGVKLPPPPRGRFSSKVRHQAGRDYERGQHRTGRVSRRRSRAVLGALKREGHGAASRRAISRQTHSAAQHRTSTGRSAAAHRAVRTKGRAGLAAAGRKAAHTRMAR
jgi:hypothetical protein